MTIADLSVLLLANVQVKVLACFLLGDLVLGVGAAIKTGDLRLVHLADWLTERLVPVLLGYLGAALIAYAVPDFSAIRDIAWGTLLLALSGFALANLRDFGIPIPDAIAGAPLTRSILSPGKPAATIGAVAFARPAANSTEPPAVAGVTVTDARSH